MSRTPGEGRYAKVEREQRWLLEELPEGVMEPRYIVDRYITKSHLRLRCVDQGDTVTYKLGQKIRRNERDPELVKITNIYLSATEYELFRSLPARTIRKNRWTLHVGGSIYCVDQFLRRHEGLFLAERELKELESKIETPEIFLREVTHDDQFSGGQLVLRSKKQIRELLKISRSRDSR